MASVEDIQTVRRNVGELENEAPFTDAYIDGLIDATDVLGATIAVWEFKVAELSDKVDVTEAGASHKFSMLHKNALETLKYWQGQSVVVEAEETGNRVRVRVIERTV
jgi:hypothetical protein